MCVCVFVHAGVCCVWPCIGTVKGVLRLNPEAAGISSNNAHDPSQDKAVMEMDVDRFSGICGMLCVS